ncbi:hypothetical protein [Nocardia sp. NPDC050718]|uniref:hypothetical protein n=1 Tax=Nocardia sp. NPDC050718 TaxID=3155788 RepID=UPI0033D24A8C
MRSKITPLVVGIGLSIAGCADIVPTISIDPPVESNSPELIEEATAFGDWQLPADARVLRVRSENLRDPNFRLAIETSPDGLSWMLDKSRYSEPLEKGMPVHPEKIIAGPPLATSPSVKVSQDLFVSQEGDSMIRAVVVDERTPELRIVHLQFRGQ